MKAKILIELELSNPKVVIPIINTIKTFLDSEPVKEIGDVTVKVTKLDESQFYMAELMVK